MPDAKTETRGTTEERRILAAVRSAKTAGEALNAIPEKWPMFLIHHGGMRYSAAFLPPNALPIAKDQWEAGVSFGNGLSRLDALQEAAAYLETRLIKSAFIEQNA